MVAIVSVIFFQSLVPLSSKLSTFRMTKPGKACCEHALFSRWKKYFPVGTIYDRFQQQSFGRIYCSTCCANNLMQMLSTCLFKIFYEEDLFPFILYVFLKSIALLYSKFLLPQSLGTTRPCISKLISPIFNLESCLLNDSFLKNFLVLIVRKEFHILRSSFMRQAT